MTTRRFRFRRTPGARFRNHPKLRFTTVPGFVTDALVAFVVAIRAERRGS